MEFTTRLSVAERELLTVPSKAVRRNVPIIFCVPGTRQSTKHTCSQPVSCAATHCGLTRAWIFISGLLLRLFSPPKHVFSLASAWQYSLTLQIFSQLSDSSGSLQGYLTLERLLPSLSFKVFDLNTLLDGCL